MPRKQRQSQYSLTGHTYSTEDIERIKKQPGVVDVTPDMITFDLNFKQGLYDDWIKSPCVDTLRRSFQERGFDLEAISERVLFSFNSHFRIHGRPTREAYRMFDKHDGKGIPHKTKDDLVAEGVLRRVSNGHRITPEYMALIKGAYDKSNGEKSIEDVIRESGYNPSDIGDFRLSYLHKVLEDIRTVESRNSKRKIKTKDDTNREVIRVSEDPEKQEKLKTAMAQNVERQKCVEPVTSTGRAAEDKQPDAVQNQPRRISTPTMWTKRMVEETPYVHVPMQDCVQLTEAFFNDAIIFQGLPLNDILAIYGMRIQPTLPKKDAYKNQVTYNHPMASPDNKLMRNFYIGPRKVVLTDITYIYYGAMRTLLYLCVFYDPFTREVLGFSVDDRMTVGLVKRAYARMMEEHGAELKNPGVYLHSDQGSQYLETSFSQLLTDDGFIRSVSRRGNSQDNAPMESFFGRMKSHIMDILALCPDMETAIRLVEGYMDAYNNENYQYTLAGLTPAEFYFYSMTGVYPCDEYYGVGREELLSVKELIAARRRAADFKAAKRRESYARQKATPQGIVERDLLKIEKRLRSLTALKEDTEEEISLLETLQSKMKEAITFLETAADDVIWSLMESHENWKRYPQLGYIYEMDGMF